MILELLRILYLSITIKLISILKIDTSEIVEFPNRQTKLIEKLPNSDKLLIDQYNKEIEWIYDYVSST